MWGIIILARGDEEGEEMAERETLAGVLKWQLSVQRKFTMECPGSKHR